MIVVSDTSPLNYLILIELQDILPKLFERVLIPEAVHRELSSPVAPDLIKRFVAGLPAWLEVRPAPEIDSALRSLDSGEQEVIALALATGADSVLIDEQKGWQAARERGLRVSGTLPKAPIVGLESDRDRMWWPSGEFESQEAGTQHGMTDPNVPTEFAVVALDVDASPVRRFELALKQKVRSVAVGPLRTRIERHLAVLIPSARDGHVR